jgi:hypothetical protein
MRNSDGKEVTNDTIPSYYLFVRDIVLVNELSLVKWCFDLKLGAARQKQVDVKLARLSFPILTSDSRCSEYFLRRSVHTLSFVDHYCPVTT